MIGEPLHEDILLLDHVFGWRLWQRAVPLRQVAPVPRVRTEVQSL